MQSAASEAVDLSKETEATKKMYGIDEEATSIYGTNCLMARRLVERGVRFVELYCGSGSGWDAHQHLEDESHQVVRRFRQADRRAAGRPESARHA